MAMELFFNFLLSQILAIFFDKICFFFILLKKFFRFFLDFLASRAKEPPLGVRKYVTEYFLY